MAKPIPQSDTKWVSAKKDKQGKVVKPGYLIQRSTGKKVTGKVAISAIGSTAYNSRGIAEYKGGRNTAVSKAAPSKKSGERSKPSGGSSPAAPSKSPAKAKAEAEARALRLKQNAGVKAGTIKPGAKGGGLRRYNSKTGRWDRVTGAGGVTTTANQNQNQGGNKKAAKTNSASGGYQTGASYVRKTFYGGGKDRAAAIRDTNRGSSLGTQLQRLQQALATKKIAANNLRDKKNKTEADKANEARLRREIADLSKKLKG